MDNNNWFTKLYTNFYISCRINFLNSSNIYKKFCSKDYVDAISEYEGNSLIKRDYFIDKYRRKHFKLYDNFDNCSTAYYNLKDLFKDDSKDDYIKNIELIISFVEFYNQFQSLPEFTFMNDDSSIECKVITKNNDLKTISFKLIKNNKEIFVQSEQTKIINPLKDNIAYSMIYKDKQEDSKIKMFKLYIMDINNKESKSEFNYISDENIELDDNDYILITTIIDSCKKEIRNQLINILKNTISFYSPELLYHIEMEELIRDGLWIELD